MASFQPSTVDMVRRALEVGRALTVREVTARLPFDLSPSTVRNVLLHLVDRGDAAAQGDISLKRYQLPGEPPCTTA